MSFDLQTSSTVDSKLAQAKQLLIKNLETGNEAQQCASARALAIGSVTEGINALNQGLQHSDPDVIVHCANALHCLKSGDIDALSLVVTQHPEGDCRLAAAKALQTYSEQNQVTALYRKLATRNLGDCAQNFHTDWDDGWDLQLLSVKTLVARRDHKNVHLFKQLLSQDPEPELETLLYLGIVHFDSQYLISKLDGSSLSSTRRILNALPKASSRDARVTLFKHLSHCDAKCRSLAIEGLSKLSAKEYLWDVIHCLTDPDTLVRKSAQTAIKKLDYKDKLDDKRLLSYMEKVPSKAQCQLLSMIDISNISEQDLHCLIDQYAYTNPELLTASPALLAKLQSSKALKKRLVQCYQHHLSQKPLDNILHSNLIRSLKYFDNHTIWSFPYLESRINGYKQTENTYAFSSQVRQACFSVLSLCKDTRAYRVVRTSLLGINTYGEIITSTSEQTDQKIIDDHRVPEVIVSSHSQASTLDAIRQTNQLDIIVKQHEHSDQRYTIESMVDKLDPGYSEYSQLVKDNFLAAEGLELNRKKIVTLPQTKNQILAIRALADANTDDVIDLLLETASFCDRETLCEILIVSTQQRGHHTSFLSVVDQCLKTEERELCIEALRYLTKVPSSFAIPRITKAIHHPEESVKLSALYSLTSHLDGINHNSKMIEIIIELIRSGQGSVRKLALQLTFELGVWSQHFDLIIEVLLSDPECLIVGQKYAETMYEKALHHITEYFDQLTEDKQLRAVALLGVVIASRKQKIV
ncbi:HEAT repeat domain-containing protein [Vibrio sonorensis]|uniref:HEAT repeat domain-containing protein n=1 Tax=Vibrio sonorensis TaxID=1004316 RepID=UPI0008DA8F14|nr:HEAT repeat domain-containing protein [Vibrio sonorensis]